MIYRLQCFSRMSLKVWRRWTDRHVGACVEHECVLRLAKNIADQPSHFVLVERGDRVFEGQYLILKLSTHYRP